MECARRIIVGRRRRRCRLRRRGAAFARVRRPARRTNQTDGCLVVSSTREEYRLDDDRRISPNACVLSLRVWYMFRKKKKKKKMNGVAWPIPRARFAHRAKRDLTGTAPTFSLSTVANLDGLPTTAERSSRFTTGAWLTWCAFLATNFDAGLNAASVGL